MTTPKFEAVFTGSGEVRDKDGNLVNQQSADNSEQENK